MKKLIRNSLLLCAVILAFAGRPSRAQSYQYVHSVSGGATAAAGGTIKLRGTLGQPAPGVAAGNVHTSSAGFWYQALRTGGSALVVADLHTMPEEEVSKLESNSLETAVDRTDLQLTAAGSSNLPERIALLGNYPNPFNPETTIRYELPTAQHVRLSVYDALGREVSVLVDRPEEAGRFSVRFDGRGLSSGMYFYRLETNTGHLLGQMLLVK